MGVPVLADPVMTAQLALTATATVGQLVVAKQQAKLQEKAAEADALIRLHSAEMQWFELMQGVINKEAQIGIEVLNIRINEQTKEYIDKFTELNADIALMESESLGVLADVNASNIRKDKWRVMRNAVLKVGDINREGSVKASELISIAASSNLLVDDASNDAAINSLGADIDRTASRAILEAGDLLSGLTIQERQQQVEGVRARALGRIRVQEIRKQGEETSFDLQQRITQSKVEISALRSEARNLKVTGDIVKSSGVASANAAIAAGAAQAKSTLISGGLGALTTLSSGLSNTYQTYLLKQQIAAKTPTTAPPPTNLLTLKPLEQ